MSSPNFTNIQGYYDVDTTHSKCNKTYQLENSLPNGQDILQEDIGDGLIYNCFNRADENPFKKTGYNESGDEVDKSWSDWMRIPCQNQGPQNHNRRCLGGKPSQCVNSYGRYIVITGGQRWLLRHGDLSPRIFGIDALISPFAIRGAYSPKNTNGCPH